jgi:outer membrane murein-binding lipoprotein Lpp
MARDELQAASDELRKAGESVDDEAVRERLHGQSDQLATLATRELGPDHGRLDRHMNALAELGEEVDGEASEHVERAREKVREYRETVEGV